MKKANFSVAMAHLVMETISELQRSHQQASLKDIKHSIAEKYGPKSEKVMKYVPQFVARGIGLGLIAKYGNNLRTKMYVARRRRRKGHKHGHKRHRRGHKRGKSRRRRH